MARPLINITQKQAYFFASFLVLYEFLTYIANDMIMPGMIDVVSVFHSNESAIATSLTCYILGGASLQLFLGPLSDRYGRRPIMLSGALLFFLCTLFIANTHSMDQFLSARFLQGMGLCFISVIGYATLQEIFTEMDAIRLIAIMANVSILAPLLGPVLGAAFTHYFGWRWIFIVIALFALLALWGLWYFMPEPIGQTKHDGETLKPVSLSPSVIAQNYKQLLFNPKFIIGSIASGLVGIPCIAWIALSPVILVNQAHLSLIQYGLWQIPVFGATIAGNWVLQHLTHRYSLKTLIIIGSVVSSLSLFIMLLLPLFAKGYFVWLMPGLIIYFFGLGLTGAPLNRFILFCTAVSKGTASGLMSLLIMAIQAVGIEIANLLYSTHNNIMFGLYCAVIGMIYFALVTRMFYLR